MSDPERNAPNTPEADPLLTADISHSSDDVSGGPVRSARAFAPGTVLAERFRVERFIAKGGMGEVYEAEDLDLKERVALKTVRFDNAEDSRALERFRAEVLLGRQVTHPNVCRIFDLFRHRDKSAGGEVLFVTMELLRGESLEQRIRNAHRLSAEETMPIVEQLAAGLDAAHRAGVVHRDFKSSNVMLVPPASGSGSARAVITDFGLAHALLTTGPRLTGTREVFGTPAYMAPEQLQGLRITPATDVYALGIVLFEMLTGRLPFQGDTPLAAALKRLSEPTPSPRRIVPDLDVRWEAAILRCLERKPEQRFARTTDVLKVLTGESVDLPSGAVPRPLWTRPWAIPAALALLALAAVGAWRLVDIAMHPKPPVTAVAPRRSVAVFGFANTGSGAQDATIGPQLADAMVNELDSGQLRMIPASLVRQIQKDLFLRPGGDGLTSDVLSSIRKYSGADVLVSGAFTTTGKAPDRRIRWDVRVQSASTGEILGTFTEEGAESDLLNMMRRAGGRAREKLGVQLSPEEAKRLDAALTTNPEAARLYSEGLEKLRDFDVLAAIRSLEAAVRADPAYPLSYSALSEAWSTLGYDRKAQEAAKKAVDLSVGLSGEQRKLAEARSFEMNHEWEKAIAAYSALWQEFKDNPEYALRLAAVQTEGGKASDALGVLGPLREGDSPPGVQARVSLQEASAASSLGQSKQQLAAASRAADLADSLGARLLLARARVQQCDAHLELGEPEQAVPLCEQARDMDAKAGDLQSEARAISVIGNALRNQGKLAEAKKTHEQALKIARGIDSLADISGALNNIANVETDNGQLAAAEQRYVESLEYARKRGSREAIALELNNLAGVLVLRGDRKRALDNYEEARRLAAEIGDEQTVARALNNICMVAADGGDLRRAKQSCTESLHLREQMANKTEIGLSLAQLGVVLLEEGDTEGARKSFQDSLDIHRALGEKGNAAWATIGLADVALETGNTKQAADYARSSVNELAKENDSQGEGYASATGARALLQTRETNEARALNQRAAKMAEATGDPDLKIRVAVNEAYLAAGARDTARARRLLDDALREAQKAHFVAAEFRVRLAMAQIDKQAGNAGAEAEFKSLARDAGAAGFNLIAKKAAGAS